VSKHRREKTAREVTCDRITERIAALIEPWTEHVSQIVRTDDGRGRLVATTIDQPSLLEQLANPAGGSTAGIGSATAGSRMPIHVGALAALQDIEAGAALWFARVDRLGTHARRVAYLVGLGDRHQLQPADLAAAVHELHDAITVAGDLERVLRRIAQAAPTLPDETLGNLDRDVTSWWGHARVATTWGDPPLKPHVPCAACGVMGRILVRQDHGLVAVCTECGTVWDALTIDALGEHVRLAFDMAAARETERLIEARACATCGQLHSPGHYPSDEILAAHRAAAPVELHGALA
jgi:hypothetical protein